MIQTWFECKVKYVKVDQDGRERQVTESFLLDAVSFTDAEARITAQMQSLVRGEFTITDIRKSKIAEVFPFEAGEWWYRCTINLSTIDEEAGKEKKLRTTYLVQADDLREALNRLEESLSFLIVPYVASSIAVSTIADVFPYVPGQAVPPLEMPFKTPVMVFPEGFHNETSQEDNSFPDEYPGDSAEDLEPDDQDQENE